MMKHRARLTMGVLFERAYAYNLEVLSSIADMAREQDVNLIAFAGGALGDPRGFVAQGNIIYELARTDEIDGLIILTSALGHFTSRDEISHFCQSYAPLPMVSLGNRLENIPSIIIDNHSGLRDLMIHLIADHGYRRIAFVKGPENNPDAQQRYQSYTEILAQFGLPLDPDLVAPGDFNFESGLKAVELLLDRRKVEVDVVMTACDGVALAVLEALRLWDIQAPETIAVVGFDDLEQSKYAIPPLTTVRQPIREHGRRAVEMLLAQLRGQQVACQVTLPTELVIRQSCGCPAYRSRHAGIGNIITVITEEGVPKKSNPFETIEREAILAEMNKALIDSASRYQTALNLEGTAQLLEVFLAELKREETDVFLPTLDKLLRQMITRGGEIIAWQDVLFALRRQMLSYSLKRAELSQVENLCYQAQELLGERLRQAQVYQSLFAEKQAQILREIDQALMAPIDLNQLITVIAQKLPYLGIDTCYLCLYERPPGPLVTPPLPEWSRLKLAYTKKGRTELEAQGRRFRSQQLAAIGLWPESEQYLLLVLPLYFKEDQLGFLMLEMGPQEDIYEPLQDQISRALQGVLLEERRQLEAEYYKVQRIESIDRLAGGIAHNFNNLLMVINGFADLLQAELAPDDPHQESVDKILRAGRRAAELVKQLLTFSRKQMIIPQKWDLNKSVIEMESFLRRIIGEKIELETRLSPELWLVEVDPAQIRQVIVNMAQNARDAMPGGGRLTIETVNLRLDQQDVANHGGTQPGKYILLTISDNGHGMSAEAKEHVFEPFFTTKEVGKGTGLGLAVIYGIIKQNGGNIWVDSKEGSGTTFKIYLPVIN